MAIKKAITTNVERMSSSGLKATALRLTTKFEKRNELKY